MHGLVALEQVECIIPKTTGVSHTFYPQVLLMADRLVLLLDLLRDTKKSNQRARCRRVPAGQGYSRLLGALWHNWLMDIASGREGSPE